MASDADSLKRSGGLGTEPKTFSPADLAKEPVFASEITSPAGAARKAGASSKKTGLVAGVIAILAVAAAVGYFFVWPLLSPKEEPQETVVTTPPPTLPTETPSPASTHQSYFSTSPSGGSKEAALTSLTLSQLSGALRASSGEATSTGVVKEIVFTANGSAVTSANLVGLLFPASGLEAYLESDATIYAYYSNNKTYPGYIFKLKDGADAKAAEAAATKIEASANLAALYPESPGAPKGSWKDGSVGSTKTRYLAYSVAGASINYGWVNNYLVISTSFDGFKKAVELLPSQ